MRESAIYDKLKKGPVFKEAIEDTIPRKPLVEKIKQLTGRSGHDTRTRPASYISGITWIIFSGVMRPHPTFAG